jgi:hypothetical protein
MSHTKNKRVEVYQPITYPDERRPPPRMTQNMACAFAHPGRGTALGGHKKEIYTSLRRETAGRFVAIGDVGE